MKALIIGDPFAAPLKERTTMHNLPHALNTVDDMQMA